MTAKNASEFLKRLVADCPFKIHRVLTDNGAQFTYELLAEHLRPKDKEHVFDATCRENGIKHKLTKFRHPWTNGQVEVFNRVIKEHTVKYFYYETCDSLKNHMMAFILLHNFKRPLRALKYRTPYDILIERYRESPQLFKENPHDKLLGLNTGSGAQSSGVGSSRIFRAMIERLGTILLCAAVCKESKPLHVVS